MKTVQEVQRLIVDAYCNGEEGRPGFPWEWAMWWCGAKACACMGAFNCGVNPKLKEPITYEEWKRWQQWKLTDKL